MSCSRRSTARSCCLGKSGGTWGVYSTSLPAQGMPDRGGALDAQSCAHVDIDSTEVFGVRGDRVSEREELDLDCAERGTQAAEFSGSQVLGEVLLGFHQGAGGRDGSRLYQEPGDG